MRLTNTLKSIMFFIFVLLFLCILEPKGSAQEYYADLDLEISSEGSVKISGLTNYKSLYPGIYFNISSKKGNYWLLNLSFDDKFSDYIISASFPEDSEINYIKTSGRSRITYDSGLKVIASGTDSLSLIIQYQINEKNKSFGTYLLILVLVLVLGIISGWFIIRSKKNINANKSLVINEKKIKKLNVGKSNSVKPNNSGKVRDTNKNILLLKKTLGESQVKIIDILIEAGGELTQKQIQHRSELPKATLSRNIDVLVKKNILLKQSRGMTNSIKINEEFMQNEN